MLRIVLVLCFMGALAQAEHLVFTTVTPGTSPLWISSPEQSKDFGFQSLALLNDSEKSIQSVHLKVTFATGRMDHYEEIVDSGHVYVSLDPGEQKRMEVFLGRIEALKQKLQSMRLEIAWVKITVESAEFTDGSRWDPDALIIDIPIAPVK
ncbi:MAG: hypothetical protein JO336_19360 [Acidobacteriia bacterium]|nr:hypothetical protein [Terriglobia bacterium]